MARIWTVVISAATSVVIGVNPAAVTAAQQPGRGADRTEKGFYLLKVVEPGYDVTVKEVERGAEIFRSLEMTGLVPTITAGGVVLFRAMYDIEQDVHLVLRHVRGNRVERVRVVAGRRISVVTKVFMTNDAKMPLKELMGPDYTDEAQQLFNLRGYQSVAELAKMFGGRGMVRST